MSEIAAVAITPRRPGREKPGWRVLFPVLCLLLLAECSKQSSSPVTFNEEISPQPVHVGPSTVTVTLTDSVGKPVTGAHVTFEADMSHAGMAPVFGAGREVAPGHYQGDLQFSMGGDWVVLTRAILADGRKAEHQMTVNGVRAN